MDQEPTETKTADNDNNNGVNRNLTLESKFGNLNIDNNNELYLRLRSSTWPMAAVEDLLPESSPGSNEVSNQNNFEERSEYLTSENELMAVVAESHTHTHSQQQQEQQQQQHHLHPQNQYGHHQYSLMDPSSDLNGAATMTDFENCFRAVLNEGRQSSEMQQQQRQQMILRPDRCDQMQMNVCPAANGPALATSMDNAAAVALAAAVAANANASLTSVLLANRTNSYDLVDCLPPPPPPPQPLSTNTSAATVSSSAATVATIATIATTATTATSPTSHTLPNILGQPSVANGYIKKASSRRNAWGNYSYADLITKAISNSAQNRLTLSEIYDWMIRNITYFRDKGDSNSSAGWKNSIRHNLSLHNRFMRVPNEGTGKSSWWMINPDAQPGKAIRRRANTIGTSKVEKRRGRVKKKTSMSPPSSCFAAAAAAAAAAASAANKSCSSGPTTNASPASSGSDGGPLSYSISPPSFPNS